MDNSVKDFIMLFSVLLISSLIMRHKHQWNVLQNSVDRKQIFLIQIFTFFSKIKFNMCVSCDEIIIGLLANYLSTV